MHPCTVHRQCLLAHEAGSAGTGERRVIWNRSLVTVSHSLGVLLAPLRRSHLVAGPLAHDADAIGCVLPSTIVGAFLVGRVRHPLKVQRSIVTRRRVQMVDDVTRRTRPNKRLCDQLVDRAARAFAVAPQMHKHIAFLVRLSRKYVTGDRSSPRDTDRTHAALIANLVAIFECYDWTPSLTHQQPQPPLSQGLLPSAARALIHQATFCPT